MQTIDVSIPFKKLHEDAVIPFKKHLGDAGYDLTAVSFETIGGKIKYNLGISVEIPFGYVGLIFPRSSICKYDLVLTNSVGVIDSGYTGEISAVFALTKAKDPKIYQLGDRVAQLVIVPILNARFIQVDELSKSERGDKGYGSTGE